MNKEKISYWLLVSYFIIYSVIGFILETIFGFYTKGIIESRKSFLFGPFCIIYGIGALIIILFLSKYKKNILKLFFGSCIIGVILEYFMSYFCEKIFHFKWWDYSRNEI